MTLLHLNDTPNVMQGALITLLYSAQIGNYLTLMEQLSAIINEAMFNPCGTSSPVQSA